MVHLRPAYEPEIVSSAKRRVLDLRVGGKPFGGAWDEKPNFYKDDVGGLWRYRYENSTDSPILGSRIRASTDAYGGVTSRWYEGGFNQESYDLDLWMDNYAVGASLDTALGKAFDSSLDTWSATSDPDSGSHASEVSLAEDSSAKRIEPPTASGVVSLKQIQSTLIFLGYDLGSKGADGMIGPATRAAIVKFKNDNSISPTNAVITEEFRTTLTTAATAKKEPIAAAAGWSGNSGIIIAGIAAVLAVGAYFLLKGG